MKKSSRILLGVLAVLVIALVAFLALHRSPPTDTELIQAQITGAEQAAQNRDISSMMTYISTHYHDAAGFNKEALYFLMTHSVNRDNGPFHMTISQPSITVTGDTATSDFQLTVTSSEPTFNHEVTLQWKREEGRQFLIFPAKVWRVVGADYGPAPGID